MKRRRKRGSSRRSGAHFELARVSGAVRARNAGVEREGFDANEPGIEIRVFLEERAGCLRRHIAAPGERDVRMPRAQIRLEPGTERCFLHLLVDVEELRMAIADAGPEDVWFGPRREHSDAHDR